MATPEEIDQVKVAAGVGRPDLTDSQAGDGPQKIGKYIMLETLGEGGFSTVKLGLVEGTEERVALKLLKKNRLDMSSTTKRQVEREIAAMSLIDHPNVIRMREVDWDAHYFEEDGRREDAILIVLELAAGGELFEFLGYTGCFEEAIARTFFHQLIAGVAHCHAKGVAHRDLKPENILLDDQFNLKLADFGLSGVFTSADRTMYTSCGTTAYMAPEMIRNHGGYEPTGADIWSTGVILFIMLAGFPPFQRPAEGDWWFNKLSNGKHHLFWQAHSRNAYFSDATKDLINKILCPDPARRISINDIRKHPWFNGPVISPAALYAELSRRKAEVTEAKFREQLEKKRRMAAANAAAVAASPLSATVDRDLDIPLAPPTFDFTAHRPAAAAPSDSLSLFSSSDSLASIISGASASTSVEEEGSGGSSKAVPPRYVPPALACYTRFESSRPAAAVLQRVARALAAMGQYEVDEKAYMVLGSVVTASGTVTLHAQVSAKEDGAASTTVVEFRRRKGDSMQYRQIFLELRSALSDLIDGAAAAAAEGEEEADAASALSASVVSAASSEGETVVPPFAIGSGGGLDG